MFSNSCFLATKTCISFLAAFRLHSTCCWDPNPRTSYRYPSIFMLGLFLPLQLRLSVRNVLALSAQYDLSATRSSDVSDRKAVIVLSSARAINVFYYFRSTIDQYLTYQPVQTVPNDTFLIVLRNVCCCSAYLALMICRYLGSSPTGYGGPVGSASSFFFPWVAMLDLMAAEPLVRLAPFLPEPLVTCSSVSLCYVLHHWP